MLHSVLGCSFIALAPCLQLSLPKCNQAKELLDRDRRNAHDPLTGRHIPHDPAFGGDLGAPAHRQMPPRLRKSFAHDRLVFPAQEELLDGSMLLCGMGVSRQSSHSDLRIDAKGLENLTQLVTKYDCKYWPQDYTLFNRPSYAGAPDRVVAGGLPDPGDQKIRKILRQQNRIG